MQLSTVIGKLRSHLEEHNAGKLIDINDNLFELGVIDSFGLIKLVLFIEHELSVNIDLEDLDENNFSSIDKISQHILKHK
jgi:acyl carrier protein